MRFGTVEVRVGDYALDNTHPIRGEGGGAPTRVGRVSLPLTDDEKPIQLALWRSTDRAFKQGTESLTRVRTNIAAKVQQDNPAADFSREEPQVYLGAPVRHEIDNAAWEARLRRISAPFKEDPLIFSGSVSLTVRASNRYHVNSEGSRLATGELQYRLFINAATKADDGMELPLYRELLSRSLDGLPDEKQLLAETRSMIDLLARLRKAPLVDPYSGPQSCPAAPPASSSTRSSPSRRGPPPSHAPTTDRPSAARSTSRCCRRFLSVVFDPTARRGRIPS